MRKSLPYTKLNHNFSLILHLLNHFNDYADLPQPYLQLVLYNENYVDFERSNTKGSQ